ncbi:MAG: Ni/Fe-hydrogenase, b-type cytochrome subunit [Bacteroidales bacterium]|nr:Ni/Fe-hydrogenase, b-type cytochrome subunit [Bacteroidales bacterium]MCF6341502.1 Ni/Fe-hydrogenase, b-type cytochrome subunit [Bacteroidales bacterium]
MHVKNHITKTLMHPVYVWELPVRFFHWINALSIVALAVTGFIIGDPPAIQSATEASFSYWFGTVRIIHFIAAYVFFFNFVFRIYWGFVGNRFANWKNFIPYTKRSWIDMWEIIRVDILQIKSADNPNLGHNALASFTYFITFLAFLLQVLTGFGIYATTSSAWLPALFAWVPAMLGGDMVTRDIHHLMMWVFALFAMVHVYLVFYHDYIDWNGTTSSIIGGWKFQEEGKEEREKELDK